MTPHDAADGSADESDRSADEPGDAGLPLGADAGGLSRRSLLRAGLHTAAGAVVTATGVTAGVALFGGRAGAGFVPSDAASSALSSSTRGSAAHPVTARIAATHPQHAPAHPNPPWLHTWSNPIRRLDSYVAHQVGERFPKHAIMLTIDDGPHPVWTPRYLRLLAKHHVRATFSVIGEQVRGNAHLLKAMVAEGHHIGNHTFHHPLNLPSLSHRTIRAELEDTTDAVVRASGFRPRQFRAPGGVWGPDVFAEVSRQRMMPLGWDIDPRDWALPGVAAIRRAMLAAKPHDVILCHDGGGDREQTYRALETVIPALHARGWTFVTLPAPQ